MSSRSATSAGATVIALPRRAPRLVRLRAERALIVILPVARVARPANQEQGEE